MGKRGNLVIFPQTLILIFYLLPSFLHTHNSILLSQSSLTDWYPLLILLPCQRIFSLLINFLFHPLIFKFVSSCLFLTFSFPFLSVLSWLCFNSLSLTSQVPLSGYKDQLNSPTSIPTQFLFLLWSDPNEWLNVY